MDQATAKPAITPEMKVAALLDAYPDLEALLYEIAPAFAKLRNPILRKTVARVTTLRQAARVAGVELATMINRLREAAGQSPGLDVSSGRSPETATPVWVDQSRVVQTFDARSAIERGEQPMGRIMAELKKLKGGEVYELITPFVPAPLIDLAAKQGYEAWFTDSGNGVVRTCFRRTAER
ncbi:MAG: DUF1858 domain-containing protein [candidate division Zixibacteria bacterium]|nr:DUF1858 domain-containing protein [candidate division Zixibacteria bacterium]